MKKITLLGGTTILLTFIILYFMHPTIAYGFNAWSMGLTCIIIVLMIFESGFSRNKLANKQISKFNIAGSVAVLLLLLYTFVLPLITSTAVLRSGAYRDLIGEVKMGDDFTEQVAPISTEEIRIVDQLTANRLGDKVLGSIPSLGSQAFLGEFSIQNVKGELFWVAPLLHSGFFKWNNNKEGTPGYVMVSASNERDVRLVQDVNGKPVRIKYQPGAFFNSDLSRHIYFNGYMTKGYTDYSFEIDDEGKPYWIITLFDRSIGFAGEDATGVIVVDVETGDIKEYGITDAPKWIDRIQPEKFITKQLDDWGEFVHGYFNFSNENKLTTTRGISLVYGSDDRSYWYTGLTSVGSDEGTVGFVLVDTRTKETVWYKQVGATEQAARLSAMGKVQEKRYVASFPITYNITGIPTYVMSLKDNAGLIKMIAMVSVEDYTIVGVGNNIKEALRAYKNSLNSKGNSISTGSFNEAQTINALVERISNDIRNGNTNYYMMLEGHPHKLFVGSSLVSGELPITQKGDSVMVKFDENATEIIDIVSFDNLNVDLKKD